MNVSSAEQHAALVCKGCFEIKPGGKIGALDLLMISKLKYASAIVEELVKSEGKAFDFREVDRFGSFQVAANRAGKLLRKIIRVLIPLKHEFEGLYTFEPYIDLVAKKIVDVNLQEYSLQIGVTMGGDDAKLLAGKLNAFINELRIEANSSYFQKKINNYHRSSNKNYRELNGYVDSLFDKYSRLLVIRVDLSYLKEHASTTQLEAKRDRERFLGNMRSNKIFLDAVGYVWKLEHGPDKGFHYHVMFFFDGSKVREDGTLARRIGQYWCDVVTRGRGVYYNCNAVKFVYKSCGIGMVTHSDYELREGLRRALIYLTKTDLYMKLQATGRGMGKGCRPSPKKTQGRPRLSISQ